ncbi:MAG: hypothetical protein U5K28_07005 [Halobacteriales archaeon]|nr:hypothetical protein [Halobacteriales archaeon]
MVARKLTATLFAMLMLTAGAAGGVGAMAPSEASTTDQLTELQQADNSSVNVTTGQQLSTVLAVTSDDVQSEVEETEFEVEYDNASEEARAEALAKRANSLRERANNISEAHETATQAYEAGELTKSEYAQRIAMLNSRASNLRGSSQSLAARAEAFSALELRAAGLNSSALNGAINDLDSVSGAGASALLQQFTGERKGEVEIDSANGLSIEVESEDGEQSRELNRPSDESANLTVNQSEALDTARESLSAVNGTWRLVNSRIDSEDGNYEFRFHVNTNTTVGQASVTVDGSAGTVVELESNTRQKGPANANEASEENPGRGPPEDAGERGNDDDERDDEDDGNERELALVVTEGEIAPNSTITVRALADGELATNVTVLLNGSPVGTTGSDGAVSVTLPASGEVKLTAGEGELEFELGENEDENEVYRNLTADATLNGGTVTATVQYNGSGVAGASVFANGERVGTTATDGTVSFTIANGTESLAVEIVKGQFEAEFEYELTDGTLTQTEGAHAHAADGDDDDRGRSDEAPGRNDGANDEDNEDDGDNEDDRGAGDENRSDRDEDRDEAPDEAGPPEDANRGGDDENKDDNEETDSEETDSEETDDEATETPEQAEQ